MRNHEHGGVGKFLAPAMAWSVPLFGGGLPQVDLSVVASTVPPTFTAGGRNTVALTVHNAGPDPAGTTTAPTPSVLVFGGDFVVTSQPPPYEVVVPADGCGVERFVTEPLPDGNIRLVFVYYFDSIDAGQSRTCTFDVQFYPSTHESFGNRWQVGSFDEETSPSDNTLDYAFIVAPASPSAVPDLPAPWVLLLASSMLVAGMDARRRRRVRR